MCSSAQCRQSFSWFTPLKEALVVFVLGEGGGVPVAIKWMSESEVICSALLLNQGGGSRFSGVFSECLEESSRDEMLSHTAVTSSSRLSNRTRDPPKKNSNVNVCNAV